MNRRAFFSVLFGAVASVAGVSVAKPDTGASVAIAIQYGDQVAILNTGYISRSYKGVAGYFQGIKWPHSKSSS